MAEEIKTKFTTPDFEKLQHLSNLLHLFHHRNKNQHRRSLWWRHFSTFRRQLNSLVAGVQSLLEIPTTHLQRTKKKAQDRQTQDQISKRLEFWRDVLLPKWHTAFSQVIADGRFTVLGLMLVAVLAQTCHVTGLSSGFDDAEVADANETLATVVHTQEEPATKSTKAQMSGEEDLGEAISRDENSDDAPNEERRNAADLEKTHRTATKSKGTSRTSSVPRKQRKKSNAIDDLFSSLG